MTARPSQSQSTSGSLTARASQSQPGPGNLASLTEKMGGSDPAININFPNMLDLANFPERFRVLFFEIAPGEIARQLALIYFNFYSKALQPSAPFAFLLLTECVRVRSIHTSCF